MAIPQATITGKVLRPNGDAMPGGSIEVELSAPGKVNDGTTDHVIGGKQTVTVATDGNVNFTLVPNDSITPTGSTYRAEFVQPDGERFTQTWTITGTGAKDIGDLVA